MRSSLLSVAAAASLVLSGLSSAADIQEWKSRSIYQVMIDRYARTDGSTDHTCEAHLFCGGTWAGLTKNLDYIQEMGFTAIQISPIVKNFEEHTAVGDAYHGYWSVDNYALNDKFGTEQDFKELVDELHKRDMLLMVDVVANNMAQAFDNVIPPKVDFSKFNPFDDKKYFHPYCNVTDWEDAENYQNCWLYPYGVALADLATETEPVISEFEKWIKQLVSNYSIDGLRIDAAKHINDAFLPRFVEASGVFAFGEVLTGMTADFCPYQTKGLLPGMPNYLDYYPLDAAFNGGSFEALDEVRNQGRTDCNDTFALGTFIENHDMPRFASKNDDLALAKNAMTYVLLNDGIPTVYQGQEQHFKGNGTPFNREPLWESGYNKTHPLFVLTSALNKLRNQAIKFNKDYLESPSQAIQVDNNHLCLRKGPSGSEVVFCITNKASKGDIYTLNLDGFKPSAAIVEVLDCTETVADGTGSFPAYMGNGEPKAYASKNLLEGSGLCPATTPAGPKNSAAGLGAKTGFMAIVALGAMAFLA